MKKGYMCYVDFHYELGSASGGNLVYPSKKDILENCACAKSCGIVEVEVTLIRNVLKGDASGATSFAEIEKKGKKWLASEKKSLKYLKAHKANLEDRVVKYQTIIDKIQKEIEQATSTKKIKVRSGL